MPSSTPAAERGRLPVARRDRRPALAALALLLVLLGALGSALLVFRSGDRESVLIANGDIPFGHVMTAGDFRTTRAAADDGNLIDASRLDEFVGDRATSAIPAGSLLSPRMFSAVTLVPDKGEAVGVVVDATRRPSEVPQAGQVVRVYWVPGQNSSGSQPSNPIVVNAAKVLSVGEGSGAGTESVTLLVPTGQIAEEVTTYSSSNNLALTVLPDDTKPDVDISQAKK